MSLLFQNNALNPSPIKTRTTTSCHFSGSASASSLNPSPIKTRTTTTCHHFIPRGLPFFESFSNQNKDYDARKSKAIHKHKRLWILLQSKQGLRHKRPLKNKRGKGVLWILLQSKQGLRLGNFHLAKNHQKPLNPSPIKTRTTTYNSLMYRSRLSDFESFSNQNKDYDLFTSRSSISGHSFESFSNQNKDYDSQRR